jgi:hypothetical protein
MGDKFRDLAILAGTAMSGASVAVRDAACGIGHLPVPGMP